MVHLSAAQMKLLVLRKIFFLCSIFLCFILLCVTLIGVCRRWQFLLLWLEGFYPPIWLSGYSFAPLSTKSVVLFSVVGTFFFFHGVEKQDRLCVEVLEYILHEDCHVDQNSSIAVCYGVASA